MKNKLKIRLFGVTFDSNQHGKLRVQELGQKAINTRIGNGRVILNVLDFDDQHLKLEINRTLKDPNEISGMRPREIAQIDSSLLFPEIQTIPDFGGYIHVHRDTQELLENGIKQLQKKSKGSVLSVFQVQTTANKLEVLLSK